MQTCPSPIIEVLTPLGASLFSGRTQDAVRVAVDRARVATAAVVRFGVKPVPLIDLESASQYWPISDPLLERYREDDLREMRRCSVEFVVNAKRYRILHPHALVTVQPQRLTGGYWNLDCGEPLDDKNNQS